MLRPRKYRNSRSKPQFRANRLRLWGFRPRSLPNPTSQSQHSCHHPPEPAEPTFPSVSPIVELPSLPEPAAPILPEVPIEAGLPPPPEPAEPSFHVATLMPRPPEPAVPFLSSQEEVAAESPISIPFPDLASYLSLRPRFDWVDTVGAIEVPHSPRSETLETNPEQIPSLIRNPWPLATDAS